jgi:hypothetical protein
MLHVVWLPSNVMGISGSVFTGSGRPNSNELTSDRDESEDVARETDAANCCLMRVKKPGWAGSWFAMNLAACAAAILAGRSR